MPCTYTPSQQEIDEENRNTEMAFKLACKAMGLLQTVYVDDMNVHFSKQEIAWFKSHLKADIEREQETARRKKQEIKDTEKELLDLQSKLKKLKGK